MLFLDVGANVEVRAQHLVQFAFLGAAFSAAVLDVRDPTVGLLTVGEEAGKGRPEIVEAHRVLAAAPGINFAGNVEGDDLPDAKVDVVVTDGFTGNVALKLMEGAARALAGAISDLAHKNADGRRRRAAAETGAGRSAAESSIPTRPAARSCSACARSPIVGHGSSGADGVANAVRLAARSAEVDAVGRTAALLREGGGGRAALAGEERRRG